MPSARLRALLVEDNPGDARRFQIMIEEARDSSLSSFELVHAARLGEALAIVATEPIDVVLLDLTLPDSAGLDTLRRLREAAEALPIVVLTGLDDERTAIEAVEDGAQDYLCKGQIETHWLVRCMRYAIERNQQRLALERKTVDLNEFTYSVSHDLKEPLRTLEAYSQFVLQGYADRLDDEGRDYLHGLARASAQMLHVIEDLLTLSHVGRYTVAPTAVETARVVSNVVRGFREQIDARGAEVRVEALPSVRGHVTVLEQVFGNLIGNALKFNESASPRIVVGARGEDDGVATFFVQDNGIGIDPQFHERIFGTFQRLNRREVYPGTGAGLAIVRRAVESLGGRVWVESQPGAGSTFLFSLQSCALAPFETQAA